jgi:chromosome segregation ATPase
MIEILVLLFFLAASIYLAYQFRSCGQQMEIMQGSNASLSADLDETRDCLSDARKENLKLMGELEKTRSDLALTRGELEKTRTALNSCTDAINGGS